MLLKEFDEDFFDEESKIKLLQQIESFNYDPRRRGWKFVGHSGVNTRHKLFWNLQLDDEEFFTDYLFNKIKAKLLEKTNENVDLIRVYLNGHNACSQGYFHVDGPPNERTFLIYCNKRWNIENGGGTVFYDEENKRYTTVQALPLTSVYFRADINHCSQPLSRDFDDLRVTAAYKLVVNPAPESMVTLA